MAFLSASTRYKRPRLCELLFKGLYINQLINHEALSSVATSRLNCYSNNAVRQSVKDRSDDEVWIRLSEESCLEMLTE